MVLWVYVFLNFPEVKVLENVKKTSSKLSNGANSTIQWPANLDLHGVQENFHNPLKSLPRLHRCRRPSIRAYSHYCLLVIFCTTNSSRVLVRESWQTFENSCKKTQYLMNTLYHNPFFLVHATSEEMSCSAKNLPTDKITRFYIYNYVNIYVIAKMWSFIIRPKTRDLRSDRRSASWIGRTYDGRTKVHTYEYPDGRTDKI